MTHDDAYERYLDDFGRELERAAAGTAPRRVRHRRMRLAFAAAGATAIAATITTMSLLAPSGDRRLDVLAEARAALAPRGEILHTVVQQRSVLPKRHPRWIGVTAGVQTTEQWSTEDPSRWRIRVTTDGANGMYFDRRGPVTGPVQVAYADERQSIFVEQRNEVSIMALEPAAGPRNVPGPLPGDDPDPITAVRDFLAEGALHDRGIAAVSGQRLRRLTGTRRAAGGLSDRMEYYVDPTTFVPVVARIQRSVTAKPLSRRSTPITVLRFLKVERLPRTAANERLLRIDAPPSVREVPLRPGAAVAIDRAKGALRRFALERARLRRVGP